LIFEGEYKNGRKNGKGKELLFEGEYLNGKRWNGKEYDKDGYIEFEIKNDKNERILW